jgi:hypothetical protein
MKQYIYDQLEDKLIEKTTYDATEVIEANKALRNSGERFTIGSKGQQMVLAARIDMDHILALKQMGYDLMSSDPAEVKRALLYVQSEQNDFMTMDGKPIAQRHQKWA